MITLIMMFSMFGVYNESLAVTLDEINKKEAKLAKEDKAVQDAQKKVTQLKVKIENMKKDKRTYTNAYYDAVDELKVALKDLEKKKNTKQNKKRLIYNHDAHGGLAFNIGLPLITIGAFKS